MTAPWQTQTRAHVITLLSNNLPLPGQPSPHHLSTPGKMHQLTSITAYANLSPVSADSHSHNVVVKGGLHRGPSQCARAPPPRSDKVALRERPRYLCKGRQVSVAGCVVRQEERRGQRRPQAQVQRRQRRILRREARQIGRGCPALCELRGDLPGFPEPRHGVSLPSGYVPCGLR